MTPEGLKAKIESLAPGTKAEIEDLTGTMDHYKALIISPAFEGMMAVEQQRAILKFLKVEIDSGEVHALTMRTYSPAQWAKAQSAKH